MTRRLAHPPRPSRRRRSRETLKGYVFIAPWLLGFLAFVAIPVAMSLYYSFCDYAILSRPVFIGWENYRMLMADPDFWIVMRNTAVYAAASLPLGIVAALAVALLLNANIRGQGIYRTIVFLPSLVPAVASAMLWLWLLNPELGLINWMLRGVGISDPPAWLGDRKYAMSALVLMSVWGIGNSVVIYLAGLQDVPRELYEASEIDGASAWDKIWHVTFPSISPVIFFNLVMGIIGSLQVFGTPYIMTQGGPEQSTRFYTMYLYDNAFRYMHMGQASAMAWIQLLIVLALTGLAAWSAKKWVHY